MKVVGTFVTEEEGEQFLNIVMEYYECDLYNHIRKHRRQSSGLEVKTLAYQLFRGLMYVHSLGICHRDIKPHNLLLSGRRLAICDFGSAKVLSN